MSAGHNPKGARVILPSETQTTAAIAGHYDELDSFYREIWGEHVHHGYWETGHETSEQAADALVALLAGRLDLKPGQSVCDIGCGYGATAQILAERHGVAVTGVTVSAVQCARAAGRQPARGALRFLHQDWLTNVFPAVSFDRIYAVESSEHMPDKVRFFAEAFRTLRPGGRFAVCAWLSGDHPRPWEIRHLLEPICREGRLPGMGSEADYRQLAERAGFQVTGVTDISQRVRRTWSICIRRMLIGLFTRPRYVRFLLTRGARNRMFAVTLFRIMLAYRTGSMRYCLLVFRRPDTPNATWPSSC